MILRALYDLAQQEGLAEDLDYEPAQLRYVLVLGPSGTSATIQDRGILVPAEGKKKPELRKPTVSIPRRTGRTSGDCAEFLVDKSDYILGWDPSGKAVPEKALKRQGLYRDLIAQALTAQAPGSPEAHALQALLDFTGQDLEFRIQPLQEALANCSSEKDKKELESSFFSIEYAPAGPTPIHLLPGVRDFWKTSRVEDQVAGTQCLVTGLPCVPVDKHPQLKNVPGGNTSGASLLSFNSPAFHSYALESNANAPIGRDASEAIGNALNRLLSRNPAKPDGTPLARRHVRLSSDTVALYWADKGSDVDWFEQVTEDPEAVAELLQAPHTGRKPALEDAGSFHTLILSGAQGRSVVRAYGCRTTEAVKLEVRRYLSQVRIQRPFKKGEGAYPLRTYLKSLAALGDEKNLPPQLVGALYMAILEGTPFPRIVMEAALRRTRAEGPEGEPFGARCGLIRAYFHRLSQHPKEISVTLDTNNHESGYLMGRLLALLDKLQQDALGSVNATLVDRYYGSASTTPGAVLPTLLRRSQHHMSKLRRERPGQAVNQDKLIQSICGSIDRFPKTLSLEQQGLFALGFHHQRQDFFTKKDAPTTL
jgi:CRISPR-associated protein Csd1